MLSSFHPHRLLAALLLGFIASCTPGCKQHKAKSATTTPQIITAEVKSNSTHLFYSGTLQPLKVYHVTSPVDGIVDDLYFNYGDQVSRNQLLMTITSTKSQQDYATALTNYIKDKDQFLQNKTNFEGSAALYKAGIIDREDYTSQKSQLDASELAFINSTNALKTIANTIPGAPHNIEGLTMRDVATLEKMLQQQSNKFSLTAPISGIVLAADKSSGSNEGDKTLSVGSEVKQNQNAVSIGNMSGISVTINVNENDINTLEPGQTALLTSPALPGIVFFGKVTDIAKQAKASESGGIASFPVVISVPKINQEPSKLVKVGMSIKVHLIINNPPQIKIPIAAVFTSKDGASTVTIVDPEHGKPRDVKVETGITDIDSVTILKGLKAGDKVIIPAH